MKVLIASTPAPGHLNPLVAIGRMLAHEGYEVLVQAPTSLSGTVRAAGLGFVASPPAIDIDVRDVAALFPDRLTLTPGPEMLLYDFRNLFVGWMPQQLAGLRAVLADFPADLILHDGLFCATLPMLLGPRHARPRIVSCGVTFLMNEREDCAPFGLGLPPARDAAQALAYRALRETVDAALMHPIQALFDEALRGFGAPPLPMPWHDALVGLPDLFLQPTVPGFEYARPRLPPNLRFIGGLPAPVGVAPLPPWWDEVEATRRRLVLVTQGTVANVDLGQLVGPTLEALADEPDLLVLATTGGRPVEAIPGGVPANARAAPFLPFAQVMPRVDALITNAGYGTVNQALALGIPLVAAGRSEDKAEVSARIAWSGAGIDLGTERPAPAALRAALRTVLDHDAHRARAQALAAEFARFDARTDVLRLLAA